METLTKERLPVWISEGIIELDNGTILEFKNGICIQTGCGLPLESGILKAAEATTISLTSKTFSISQYITGTLNSGVLRIPPATAEEHFNGRRTRLIQDGAKVTLWMQTRN